eukprot:gene16048-biopygen10130
MLAQTCSPRQRRSENPWMFAYRGEEVRAPGDASSSGSPERRCQGEHVWASMSGRACLGERDRAPGDASSSGFPERGCLGEQVWASMSERACLGEHAWASMSGRACLGEQSEGV